MSSNRKTAPASVIGIDIGKNSFHVVGQGQRGPIVLRQKWSRRTQRAQIESGLPQCMVRPLHLCYRC
jgi:transposase